MHGPYWYVGHASEADWRRAYEIVDTVMLTNEHRPSA